MTQLVADTTEHLADENPARIEATDEGGVCVIRLGGRWDIRALSRVGPQLDRTSPAASQSAVQIDMSEVDALDTMSAIALQRFRDRLRDQGHAPELTGVKALHARLLAQVAIAEAKFGVERPRSTTLADVVADLGASTIDAGREARSLVGFFGQVVIGIGRGIVNPRRIRMTALVSHMEQAGMNALPIVGLLSFLIGVVLAYQGADQLRRFGAELFVVNLLGIGVLREIGALITAIIIAGRSGSAFTAQIGTMKVTQELDAMETMGLDPIDFLVLPRIFALVFTLPLLVFFADIVALTGGAIMCYASLGITFAQFINQLGTAITPTMFWVGMVKAPVFAFVIGLVGCYQGLRVAGSAESIGKLTTKAVVESIFLVIVIAALFSVMFSLLRI